MLEFLVLEMKGFLDVFEYFAMIGYGHQRLVLRWLFNCSFGVDTRLILRCGCGVDYDLLNEMLASSWLINKVGASILLLFLAVPFSTRRISLPIFIALHDLSIFLIGGFSHHLFDGS
jgi:hypothetical protein